MWCTRGASSSWCSVTPGVLGVTAAAAATPGVFQVRLTFVAYGLCPVLPVSSRTAPAIAAPPGAPRPPLMREAAHCMPGGARGTPGHAPGSSAAQDGGGRPSPPPAAHAQRRGGRAAPALPPGGRGASDSAERVERPRAPGPRTGIPAPGLSPRTGTLTPHRDAAPVSGTGGWRRTRAAQRGGGAGGAR